MKKGLRVLIIGYIIALLLLGILGFMEYKLLNIPIFNLLKQFGFCLLLSIVFGFIAYVLDKKEKI